MEFVNYTLFLKGRGPCLKNSLFLLSFLLRANKWPVSHVLCKRLRQLFFNLTPLSMQHNLCWLYALVFSSYEAASPCSSMHFQQLLFWLVNPYYLFGLDKHCSSKWFIWCFCSLSGTQRCHSGNLTCRIYTLGSTDACTEAEFSQKETNLL